MRDSLRGKTSEKRWHCHAVAVSLAQSIVEPMQMLAKSKVLCYTQVNTDAGDRIMRKVISDLPVRIWGEATWRPDISGDRIAS